MVQIKKSVSHDTSNLSLKFLVDLATARSSLVDLAVGPSYLIKKKRSLPTKSLPKKNAKSDYDRRRRRVKGKKVENDFGNLKGILSAYYCCARPIPNVYRI